MKKGSTRYRCGRTAILLALTPMMMLNASQALTLCVGHDGHVAVEIVVQDHCACDKPSSGAAGVPADAASRLRDGRSQSCTDISTPIGSCAGSTAPGTLKAVSGPLAATPPVSTPAGIDAIETASSEPPPASASYYLPLNSVILRV